MFFFLRFKFLLAYSLSLSLLSASLGCSYKPAYLQKSAKAEVAERWSVEKIDSSKLSPDESSVYEKMGPPQYIRFFRKLTPQRQRVYEWIYADPVRLVPFVDGKQVEYAVVDENSSPLNENQKKWLFWSSIGTGTAVGLGLISYYLFGSK